MIADTGYRHWSPMSSLTEKDEDGVYAVLPGTDIVNVINEAILLAFALGEIRFSFRGVEVQVNKNSNPSAVYRKWQSALPLSYE